MTDDPAIAAIRETRRRISERYGDDPAALVEHYRQLEEKHQARMLREENVGSTSGNANMAMLRAR